MDKGYVGKKNLIVNRFYASKLYNDTNTSGENTPPKNGFLIQDNGFDILQDNGFPILYSQP